MASRRLRSFDFAFLVKSTGSCLGFISCGQVQLLECCWYVCIGARVLPMFKRCCPLATSVSIDCPRAVIAIARRYAAHQDL